MGKDKRSHFIMDIGKRHEAGERTSLDDSAANPNPSMDSSVDNAFDASMPKASKRSDKQRSAGQRRENRHAVLTFPQPKMLQIQINTKPVKTAEEDLASLHLSHLVKDRTEPITLSNVSRDTNYIDFESALQKTADRDDPTKPPTKVNYLTILEKQAAARGRILKHEHSPSYRCRLKLHIKRMYNFLYVMITVACVFAFAAIVLFIYHNVNQSLNVRQTSTIGPFTEFTKKRNKS